jgi:hypothetical protein
MSHIETTTLLFVISLRYPGFAPVLYANSMDGGLPVSDGASARKFTTKADAEEYIVGRARLFGEWMPEIQAYREEVKIKVGASSPSKAYAAWQGREHAARAVVEAGSAATLLGGRNGVDQGHRGTKPKAPKGGARSKRRG